MFLNQKLNSDIIKLQKVHSNYTLAYNCKLREKINILGKTILDKYYDECEEKFFLKQILLKNDVNIAILNRK